MSNLSIKTIPTSLWSIVALVAVITSSDSTMITATSIPSDSSATTTTTITPAIEDPTNSATSESSEDDAICFRCYDQIQTAQSLIAVHENLVKKQKDLIRRKLKADAITSPTNPSAGHGNARKPRNQTSSAANRTRSLNNNNNQESDSNNNRPIVVSRLRVARSTNGIELGNLSRNRSKDKIDPVLKQLRHKQLQQVNETCKSLYEVQDCLEDIAKECLGNLQFHSLEVFSRQWLQKLNCPPKHNPNFKQFAGLIRSIPRIEEPEKVPIPRPISSQEETQKKLSAIFSGVPLGVMLKPTLTRTASQKFNSMEQQYQFDGSAVMVSASSGTKGRHLLSANEISGLPGSQLEPITTQLLLIPCFLVLMIALVTVMGRFIKNSLHT